MFDYVISSRDHVIFCLIIFGPVILGLTLSYHDLINYADNKVNRLGAGEQKNIDASS